MLVRLPGRKIAPGGSSASLNFCYTYASARAGLLRRSLSRGLDE